MTITSSPPIRTSPTVTTVSVRLEGAAGQLVRLGDAQHLVHAVQHLDQAPGPDGPARRRRARCGSRRSTGARPCPSRPGARPPARSAPRSPVLPLRRPWLPCLHARDLLVTSASPAIVRLAVHHAPLEAARLVDDALEQPGDRLGAERPFARRCRARARAPASRAPAGRPRCRASFFSRPISQRAARPLVQQAHEHLVHAVDVVPQVVERRHRVMPSARRPPLSQRT